MFGQKLLLDIGRQEGVEHIIGQVLRDKQAMLTARSSASRCVRQFGGNRGGKNQTNQ